MERWREQFERSAAEVPDRDKSEISYRFGSPATDAELMQLESHLGAPIPPELRSMLSEFNGIEVKDKYWGPEWRPLYLSITNMLEDVPDYIRTSGNPMPPSSELGSVAFFAQQNGFAELYAVCVRPFSGFSSGQILALDHETGEFDPEHDSLADFVNSHDYCVI